MNIEKIKYLYCFFVLFVIIVFFFACGFLGTDADIEPEPEPVPINIVTIKWEASTDGYIQFYTNDINMITSTGATYWKPDVYTNITDNEFIADVNKISGAASYGFGAIFCIQEDKSGGELIAKNFYAVLIRVDGYFQIIKAVKKDADPPEAAPKQHRLKILGNESNIWVLAKDSSGDQVLHQGKNQINRIKIKTRDLDSNNIPEFDLYFNNLLVYSFEDNFLIDGTEALPQFYYNTGLNKYGFIVTLSPDEDFPVTPVHVRYRHSTD